MDVITMALTECLDCGEKMSTSARHCLRCGSVNKGLRAGRWVIPEDDPPLFHHGQVSVARSHFVTGDAAYPLLLVHRVAISSRGDRPRPSLMDDGFGVMLGIGTILMSVIYLLVLAVVAYFIGVSKIGTIWFLFALAAVPAIAAAVAWLRHYMRPVRLLFLVQVHDEVGGQVEVLPWTYDERGAWSVAAVLAAGAGLESVSFNAENSGWRDVKLPDAPRLPEPAEEVPA